MTSYRHGAVSLLEVVQVLQLKLLVAGAVGISMVGVAGLSLSGTLLTKAQQIWGTTCRGLLSSIISHDQEGQNFIPFFML